MSCERFQSEGNFAKRAFKIKSGGCEESRPGLAFCSNSLDIHELLAFVSCNLLVTSAPATWNISFYFGLKERLCDTCQLNSQLCVSSTLSPPNHNSFKTKYATLELMPLSAWSKTYNSEHKIVFPPCISPACLFVQAGMSLLINIKLCVFSQEFISFECVLFGSMLKPSIQLFVWFAVVTSFHVAIYHHFPLFLRLIQILINSKILRNIFMKCMCV